MGSVFGRSFEAALRRATDGSRDDRPDTGPRELRESVGEGSDVAGSDGG